MSSETELERLRRENATLRNPNGDAFLVGLAIAAENSKVSQAFYDHVAACVKGVTRLEAECKRHHDANLLRAVTDEYWAERDDWITEAINAENFDAVPWKVAEKLAAEVKELRSLLNEVAVKAVRHKGTVYRFVSLDRDLWDRINKAVET